MITCLEQALGNSQAAAPLLSDVRKIPEDGIPRGYAPCSMWGCKNMFKEVNPPVTSNSGGKYCSDICLEMNS